MSAALCFYEKTAGKVRNILTDRGIEAKQENPMSKMAAHMGIVMNTAIDATDSHIAQMVIEGSTMSITEAVKLRNQYRDRPGCGELAFNHLLGKATPCQKDDRLGQLAAAFDNVVGERAPA